MNEEEKIQLLAKDMILSINDIEDFKRIFKQMFVENSVTKELYVIENHLNKFPYRINNPHYLRFLMSILFLAAEYGFPAVTALISPHILMRSRIEEESKHDFLDPRNLINIARYLAVVGREAFEIKMKHIEDNPEMSEEEILKLLEGFFIISKGRIDQSKVKDEFGRFRLDPSRDFYSTIYKEDTGINLKRGFLYDGDFLRDLLNIMNVEGVEIEKRSEKELDDLYSRKMPVKTLTEDEFNNLYLNKIKIAFPGIDIEGIFKTEFHENPNGVVYPAEESKF